MRKKVIHTFNQLPAFLALLLFFASGVPAYSFDAKGEGCGTDCIQCHDINKEEVEEILKGMVEKVVSVENGPVNGMWEVEVETNGKIFPLYLHYSKKYIIAGSIVDIKTRQQVGKTPKPPEVEKVDVRSIPLEDAIVIGEPMAKKTIIVFDDPDCPYCRKFHPVMKEIVSKRKDIAFYIKLFPLVKLHPEAYDKAKAIVCENSVQLLDDAFSGKPIPPPTCDTDQIDKNIKLAVSLGIRGTPTLILQNGQIVPGFLQTDNLIKLIDSLDTGAGSEK